MRESERSERKESERKRGGREKRGREREEGRGKRGEQLPGIGVHKLERSTAQCAKPRAFEPNARPENPRGQYFAKIKNIYFFTN